MAAKPLAEIIAKVFHENQERLAPDYGLGASSVLHWEDLTPSGRGLLIAASAEVLAHLGLLGLHVQVLEDGTLLARTADGDKVVSRPEKAKTLLVESPPPPVIKSPPALRKMTRDAARLSGYPGESCSNCQGIRMKRAGTCMVCDDCSQTTGCS